MMVERKVEKLKKGTRDEFCIYTRRRCPFLSLGIYNISIHTSICTFVCRYVYKIIWKPVYLEWVRSSSDPADGDVHVYRKWWWKCGDPDKTATAAAGDVKCNIAQSFLHLYTHTHIGIASHSLRAENMYIHKPIKRKRLLKIVFCFLDEGTGKMFIL